MDPVTVLLVLAAGVAGVVVSRVLSNSNKPKSGVQVDKAPLSPQDKDLENEAVVIEARSQAKEIVIEAKDEALRIRSQADDEARKTKENSLEESRRIRESSLEIEKALAIRKG